MVESRTVDLFPEEDPTSSFRIRNESAASRSYIIDRKSALQVQVTLVTAIYGELLPNHVPASLIVTDFNFVLQKPRRFKSVLINYTFESQNSDTAGPEVVAIAPNGYSSIQPTQDIVNLKHSGELERLVELEHSGGLERPVELFATGRDAGVSAHGSLWEVSESLAEQTMLAGTIRLEKRNFGSENTARWVLIANDAQNSEMPTFLRTAILLKRNPKKPNEIFKATIEIQADIDFASRLGAGIDRLLGTERDDPIFFDPGEASTTVVVEEDKLHNLGSIELDKISAVVTIEIPEW